MDGFRSASFRDFGFSDQGFREDLRAAIAAVAAGGGLIDLLVGFGSGSATLRAGNSVECNAGDTPYPVTRNGLTFGVALSAFTDQPGCSATTADGRFGSSINAAGNFSYYRFDVPNGTYRLRSAQGLHFQAIAGGLRIYNTFDSAVLHAMTGATAGGGFALDILGNSRDPAAWDATASFKDVVVTGGQGLLIDRNDVAQFFLNHIRFQQTA